MRTETEYHVTFEVFGRDPDEISRIVGLAPTASWREGDPVPQLPAVRARQARWALASGVDPVEPLESHLLALLTRLEAHAEAVASAARRFGGQIAIAGYLRETNPGFLLDPSIVQRAAALGLAIDFDLYCLGE